MIKIVFFSCIAIIISLLPVAKSQNLVLNPNFESVNVGNLMCSWYLSQAEFSAAMNNWTCPTGGSTDIFSSTLATSCFCSTNSTHVDAKGPQAPRSGNTYVPIVVYGSGGCTPYREYVQGQLSSPMIVGQQYCIEFYVSMADYNRYATNNIGVYFTTAPISNGSMCVYSVTPHVNYSGAPITNATGWTQLSFTFTPTQAYTNFTIGNFYSDVATTAVTVSGSMTTCRYYVEDVSIQLCSSAPVITVNNATICPGESATLTASSSMGGTTYLWNTGATTSSIVVSPGTTTTYTVTGTSGGQTGSASATVTVLPAPTVTVSPSAPQICLGQSVNLTAGGASTYSWSGGLGTGATKTVSPLTTTTYTVTGTSAAGCTGTASVTVTVNPNPTVSITPSAPQICAGSAATITAGGANTYSWSGGLGTNAVQTVSPGTTTTYAVTGTSTAGCTGTASVTVTVNPNPTVSITPSAPQICLGSSVTITAGGASTYNWSGGLGTNASQTVSPATTTTYTVTGTNTNGCTGSTSATVTVTPGLSVSITPSSPSLCLGESVLITATGGTTYSWSSGLGTNPAQTVSPTTTTTYSVTATDGFGCSGTASVTVTVNPNPTVSITPSAPQICAGSSATITAGGANTYSWSGGLGTNAVQTVSPGTTTTYAVTGTNIAGCTGTASVTVTVNPNPTVSITPSAAQICAGSSTTITAGGASTYSWSGGLGTSAAQTVSPGSTTTYTVTGTNAQGCTGTASVTVTVNSNPVVIITPNSQAICDGDSGIITATGAGSYIWSGGLGTSASQTIAPAVTTTYTVTGTDINGCSGTANAIVTVHPNPVVTAIADPGIICIGASTTITGGGALNYVWSNGSSSGVFSETPSQTTTYSVIGTDINGCTGTASVTVTVNPNLTVSVLPQDGEICEGDSIQLTASSNGSNPVFIWDTGQNGSVIIVTPPSTTNFTVNVTDVTGCTGSADATVIVNPVPVVLFEGVPLSGCVPVSVHFSNMSDSGDYLWEFGDGNTSSSSEPDYQYSVPGSYTVTLTVEASGCENSLTYTDYVNVYPLPVAGFHPSSQYLSEDQSMVQFQDESMGASLWLWDFGTGDQSTNQNPSYVFNGSGEYTVWQYVENQWGCSDSTSMLITVTPVVTFYIPNAFSPNDDGRNDYFMPFGMNVEPEEFQMLIYDRWGMQIFRSDNLNTPWDGKTPDGNPIAQGTYVYVIKVKLSGKEKIFEGIVTVVY
jgi:gliding motility-associated-like protein